MKLYSLMIVEDEDNTREGLTNYIDWLELGFQVVASVRDGKDAIEYMEQHHEPIDVILSDIRMENISGLELARYVSEQQLRTKVILLTAYRDFEYARTAISYHVVEYLLKPVQIQELKKVFRKVRQQIEAADTQSTDSEDRVGVDLIEKATDNAKQRIDIMAAGTGSKAGQLLTANLGVFQITARNSGSGEYSYGGAFDTSSRYKTAMITVRLNYAVE